MQMIELNGWVHLALSTNGEGEVTSAVQAVLPLVNRIRGQATFPFIEAHNGTHYLHLAENANHQGVDWSETEQLL